MPERTQEQKELDCLRKSFARVYGLTDDELSVIGLLGEAWNNFNQLQEMHESDKQEFMTAIHVCQNIVMSRLAVRLHPYAFSRMSGNDMPIKV